MAYGFVPTVPGLVPTKTAPRNDAATKYFQRTTRLPSVNNFTACGWFKVITDRPDAYRYIFNFDNTVYPTDPTSWIQIGWSSANAFEIGVFEGDAAAFGSNPSLTDWFFWAVQSDSTNAVGYFANRGASGFVTASSATTSFTPGEFLLMNNGADEYVNGRISNVKMWDAVLSADELELEMKYSEPQRRTRLHAWWPMIGPTAQQAALDYSGNARHLTVGGAVKVEADNGPPIQFRQPRRFRITELTEGEEPLQVNLPADGLNNWASSTAHSRFGYLRISPSTDSLNLWSDVPASARFGYLNISPSTDGLNLWNDAAASAQFGYLNVLLATDILDLWGDLPTALRFGYLTALLSADLRPALADQTDFDLQIAAETTPITVTLSADSLAGGELV